MRGGFLYTNPCWLGNEVRIGDLRPVLVGAKVKPDMSNGQYLLSFTVIKGMT